MASFDLGTGPTADPAPGVPSRLKRGSWTGGRALRAVVQPVSVCAFVVVVTFMLVRIVPGDPVTAITGGRGTDEARAALREQLHLNESLPSQFASYVRDLSRADLGRSLVQQNRPVLSIIGAALPTTLWLIAATVLVSTLTGVVLGLIAAARRGPLDTGIRTLMTVLLATPPFFLGLLILLVISKVDVLPAGGWGDGWPDNIRYLVLPSLALSCYLIPLVAKTVRQSAIEAMKQQWVESAISRGVSERRILWAHILPNSLLPVISLIGLNVGMLLTGAVVVEAVFGLPGVGQQLQNAVVLRDYPTIQGIALVSALTVVVANLVADLIARAVDPRAR
jgi:peptide/nickel transport system permease protein